MKLNDEQLNILTSIYILSEYRGSKDIHELFVLFFKKLGLGDFSVNVMASIFSRTVVDLKTCNLLIEIINAASSVNELDCLSYVLSLNPPRDIKSILTTLMENKQNNKYDKN